MRVVVQRGHCFRTVGATGTRHEQEITHNIGSRLVPLLQVQGHRVTLIGADDAVPATDIFVALHTDGNLNSAIRGASVGYPNNMGQQLAWAWKRAHQRNGWPGGYHRDNYTAALRGYYGFGKALRANPACVCFLAEHGTTTNDEDLAWLRANLDVCARAHAEAIGEHAGILPKEAQTVTAQYSPPLGPIVASLQDVRTNGAWLAAADGALYAIDGAPYTGGANGKVYFAGRKVARLELSTDGRPIIVAESGEYYGPDF